MQSKQLIALIPLSLALALTLGCGSSRPSCKETAVLYDLQQSNPAGQNGNDFVNRAIGVYPVQATRVVTPSEASRVSPAFPDKTPGNLSITLAPGAQWAHVLSEELPCTSFSNCADIAISCENYLSVPVIARFSAFDGSIEESWSGELQGDELQNPSAKDPNFGNARLRLRRDASSFLGNFKISPPAMGEGEQLERHEILLEAFFQDGKLLRAEINDESASRSSGGPDAGAMRRFGALVTLTPTPSAGGAGAQAQPASQ